MSARPSPRSGGDGRAPVKHKPFFLLAFVLASALAVVAVDASSLKPPPGVSVAIIVFGDLQCPACAQAEPLLQQAATAQNVPLVFYDFPLRQHPWAFDAAVLARFIEENWGANVSDEFRHYIYLNQPQITKGNVRLYAEKFATSRKLQIPFAVDPQGKLASKVKADEAMGVQIGLTETPTIIVAS